MRQVALIDTYKLDRDIGPFYLGDPLAERRASSPERVLCSKLAQLSLVNDALVAGDTYWWLHFIGQRNVRFRL